MRLLETIDLPAKKLASLTQAFLVISSTGKIPPLSFRQIFFKILQSEGTLKNVPPASLILILKQISTFTEQGQNEVTLKNAPGWGKWIQLGILNLNQISCRTGETILSGKETFLSGGETFLSDEETFLSGEETFLRGEETFLRGEETFRSDEETFLGGKETFGNTEKTLERSNALCRQGNKGKIIIYIKYKRRQT